MTDRHILSVDNLSFAYRDNPVLEAVSFTVEKGDFVAILGPNGGGKTTLLRLLTGALMPDDGSVQLFGKKPESALAHVGYVPQNAQIHAGFPVTVESVVRMGLSRSLPASEQADRIDSALQTVNALNLKRNLFDSLSGGQKQRVLIARALAAKPDLLLFDEPVSGVDPHAAFCFFDMLADLKKDMTILMVSHHLQALAAHVTKLACVNRRFIMSSPPVLTEEMQNLLYGQHDAPCPLHSYMNQLGAHFPSVEVSDG